MIGLSNKPYSKLQEILTKSNSLVSEWGGKLYFIYLPSIDQYSSNFNLIFNKTPFNFKKINELDIPTIDIHQEVFSLHSDPLSLFPLRLFNHYTADGYHRIAEAISKRLNDDGVIFPR